MNDIRCLLWHKWKVTRDKGGFELHVCSRCGKRRLVKKNLIGYQARPSLTNPLHFN